MRLHGELVALIGDPGRPRLLVLRALGLGDLLTAVPALRALRRGLPDHLIILAAPAWLAPLVELIGAVDELQPTADLADLPRCVPPPDLGVNLHGCGPQSLQALRRSGARHILSHRHRDVAGLDGPDWMPGLHEVVRWCRLVEWFGLPADPSDLLLPPPPAPRPEPVEGPRPEPVEGCASTGSARVLSAPARVLSAPARAFAGAHSADDDSDDPDDYEPIAVVHPGASAAARRWPADRFAQVARELARRGYRVVITGSAAERSLGENVARQAGLPPSAVLAGSQGLAELAGQVSTADLVVCGDTGVGHLASAYQISSVLLFGPTSPARWGPPAGPHSVLWRGVEGDPHADVIDPGLDLIQVGDVIDAVDALPLAGRRYRQRLPRDRPVPARWPG